MHDVAVELDRVALGHRDRADLGDPADVVAAQVEQHEVLGQLLGVAQQVLGQARVLGGVGAARPGAGDRPDGDPAAAQAHQDLRARADHGEAVQVEEEEEGRGVEPPERAVEREGRQGEGQGEALGQHDLEDVAGEDVLLAPLDHGVEGLAGHVGGRLRQVGGALGRLAPERQGALEVGDDLGQAGLGLLVGALGVQPFARAHRGDHGHLVLDPVEDADHRGPEEEAVGHAQHVLVLVRQALHQAHRVVAHVADQTGGHGRQARRQGDGGLGDQGAQGLERRSLEGLEGLDVEERPAVDLGGGPAAAPDQVRLEADEGVAPDGGPALDRLEEAGIAPPVAQLEEGRDRRFQVGHQGGPDHLGAARVVGLAEVLEVGRRAHGQRRERTLSTAPWLTVTP